MLLDILMREHIDVRNFMPSKYHGKDMLSVFSLKNFAFDRSAGECLSNGKFRLKG